MIDQRVTAYVACACVAGENQALDFKGLYYIRPQIDIHPCLWLELNDISMSKSTLETLLIN